MEVKNVQINGKSYTVTVVHWCSQKNTQHGVTQAMVVFNVDGKLIKAKIIEHLCDGCPVYTVYLINEGTVTPVTLGREGEVMMSPVPVKPVPAPVLPTQEQPVLSSFKPARCSVDQTPVLGDRDLVLKSPLAGLVVKIKVAVGQFVAKNQPMVVIESMKMENEICAPFPAFIKTLSISEGNLVKPNQVIVTFERRGGRGDAATKRCNEQEVFEC